MEHITYKFKTCNVRNKFNILIIDDELEIAEMLGSILKTRGHDIVIETKGISGLSKCQDNKFDIIFMDFHIGDMNGIDIADLLKNRCMNTALIFAFTGDDSKLALQRFKKIGMNGAIIKPIDINIINKLMSSLEVRNNIDVQVIKNFRDIEIKKHFFIF